MRRFRFSLEAVLRYRRTMEELRGQALAAVQQELAECEARLNDLSATLQRIASEPPAQWDAALLLQKEQYQQMLAERILDLRAEREHILGRLDAAHKALLTARQERRAVERVREGHYQQYLKEAASEEQKLLDDAGATHAARTAAAPVAQDTAKVTEE
ncbi:MAG: flagellar export protein FliJ [Chthonomonadales bacterium]